MLRVQVNGEPRSTRAGCHAASVPVPLLIQSGVVAGGGVGGGAGVLFCVGGRGGGRGGGFVR